VLTAYFTMKGFSNRDRYILRRCDIKLSTQVVGAIAEFTDRRTTVVTTTYSWESCMVAILLMVWSLNFIKTL
jgi:hypothetical protein